MKEKSQRKNDFECYIYLCVCVCVCVNKVSQFTTLKVRKKEYKAKNNYISR